MVSLVRWIIGFVSFRFDGGFADGFINECYALGEPVRNLTFDGGTLFGKCPASHYLAISRIAKRHGGRLKIVGKSGVIFPLLKIKNRLGLFVGAVVFAVLLSFLSGFVWNVEIVGNSRMSENEIVDFLSQNGLSRGVYWDNVEKDRIENLMMASFDDCAWVHINELGTTARVEINETKVKPRVENNKGFANLRATEDGLIVKATVYDGWAAAKVGDSVTKGDLLISGVYDSEKKKGNQFAHARGEYIAQVKTPFELVVSREQSYKSYTQTAEYKTVLFFGLRLPLYLGVKNTSSADVSVSNEYLKINGNDIPIGVETVTVKRYVVEKRELSDRELTALCKKETDKKIQSDFSDCKVIKKQLDVSLESDKARAKGKIICLKNIGREVPVKIKRNAR